MSEQTRQSPRNRIFIVDDAPMVAQGLQMLLRSNGYTVSTFESAEAFLATLGDDKSLEEWDCGLVDVHLPGMNGLDLAAELQARGMPPSRLLVMTGQLSRRVKHRAAQLGLPAPLAKPLAPKAVLEAVRQALAG